VRIHIVAVGRMRRDGLQRAFEDYRGRSKWPVLVREINERRSPAGDAAQRHWEADQLLAAVPDGASVVVLDETGRDLASPDLASMLGAWRDDGIRDTAFLIGGADGHDERVRSRADAVIRFGRLTWPHLMVRVMLMEQIYRAQTILAGHPYHRGSGHHGPGHQGGD
jgi:23S rRNA (pseudouridine1915-N3)-methyltransferase